MLQEKVRPGRGTGVVLGVEVLAINGVEWSGLTEKVVVEGRTISR